MADEEQMAGIGRVVGIDLGTTNSLVAYMEIRPEGRMRS